MSRNDYRQKRFIKVIHCIDCDSLTSWSLIKLCKEYFYLCDSCGNLVSIIKAKGKKMVKLTDRAIIVS